MSVAAKILDRLRKLVALSKGTTEHEAKLAAEMAAQIMAEHNIAEADLTSFETKIEIEEGELGAYSKRRPWQGILAVGIEALVGGRHMWTYNRTVRPPVVTLKIVGTPAAVTSAQYLFPMFARAIDGLAEDHWDAHRAGLVAHMAVLNTKRVAAGKPAWRDDQVKKSITAHAHKHKRSFRLGCATRLTQRMIEVAAARRNVGASAHALVVLDKVKSALDDRMATVKTSAGSTPSSAGAYAAGIKAADTITIAAGSALHAPAPSLPEKT